MKYTCDRSLPFAECELAILRNAIDEAEDIKGFEMANSKEIKDTISIVESFIKTNNLICYGGTAINNILPEEDQFYDKAKEIPDYDFLSSDALRHAKELANIYYDLGYEEVEAKAGQHFGTYKVFVNFIPIADITQINKNMFKLLSKEAISVDNILYLPPNMLRMSMYLELSRPAGDISRWEKVLKRLTLLNKHYPLQSRNCSYDSFARKMEASENSNLFELTRDFFISNGVVFFGGFASNVFSNYMPNNMKKMIKMNPDFDVLSTNAKETVDKLNEIYKNNGIKSVTIKKHDNVDEYVPIHYEVKVGKDTVAFIYQTIACYSYNNVSIQNKKVKIATIDTMLSLFLAFIYTNRSYYDKDRILCMASFLFKIQQKNRLAQKGPLKRFNIECYGEQATRESMRAEKSEKYEELRGKNGSKEFEAWFLNYKPMKDKEAKVEGSKKATKHNKKTKKIKKSGKKSKKQNKSKDNRSKKTLRNSIQRLLKPMIK